MDEAIPAGNAIAALSIARLGHLLGETRYINSSECALRAAWGHLSQAAYAHAAFLHVLEEYLYPAQLIILRGTVSDCEPWQQVLQGNYLANRQYFCIPPDARDLPGLLGERKPPTQGVLAYICHGRQCKAPIDELDAFRRFISSR